MPQARHQYPQFPEQHCRANIVSPSHSQELDVKREETHPERSARGRNATSSLLVNRLESLLDAAGRGGHGEGSAEDREEVDELHVG